MRKYLFLSCLVLLVALSAFYYAFEQGYFRFNYPFREEFPVQGLDVSHHQGDIDWQRVDRRDFSFVYMKATEGGDHTDSDFAGNWREAREAGFIVGAYHFYTFCRPVEDQITHFTATVPAQPGTLPPALDLEFGGNCKKRPEEATLKADLLRFSAAIEEKYGVKPLLYMTRAFYDTYHMAYFPAHPVWFRNIFFRPSRDVAWSYWQFANRGRVDGIPKVVDLNVFRGSRLEFLETLQ
ncbi:GH25 family lysozyme [Emcibacter sp.]|uniref:GH25 family lysozyme n=1 Tax=Emcibacter sp. TaxID=1979954 RepID=UPI002AA6F5D7|nr:GH25 family lysozyme [Emcibacter sp.]